MTTASLMIAPILAWWRRSRIRLPERGGARSLPSTRPVSSTSLTPCLRARSSAGALLRLAGAVLQHGARAVAGRNDLRWHDLRHSGAVLAAATGATLAELMARLGRSTPAAAMRYQHAAGGRDREIAALLSKLAQNG
jgi:integrase